MRTKTVHYLSIAFFVSLLVWGTFVTLVYFGIPIHGAVLLPLSAEGAVQAMCGMPGTGVGHYLCRGVASFVPSLSHTIGRASPFLWYFVISALLYGGFLLKRQFSDGDAKFRVTWAPWKVFTLFLVLLWVLFTSLSMGVDHGNPVRLYVEPTAETYNTSGEGIQALQKDYRALLRSGCLQQTNRTDNGTGIYQLRMHCIQMSFVARVLTQVLFVLVLLFEFLILGRLLLSWMGFRTGRPLVEAVTSLAIGACGWIALLWFVAVIGIYTSNVGWVLALSIPVIGYRQALYWLHRFLYYTWTEEREWYDIRTVLQWLLISYIALNFLNVVRPFPIGWDDLGSYLNRPRLLTSYGTFIFSMSPFEWGYLTSLGFLLFGYQSVVGATAAMMVNWTAGLLAVLGIYTFSRVYLGKQAGTLSALLYYSLPLVGHFSFADMKIDNAVFFFGTMATLYLCMGLFPPSHPDKEEADDDPLHIRFGRWLPLLLAGLFGGFAFATKITAIMVVLALGATIAGVLLHWTAFLGIATLALYYIIYQGDYIGNIFRRVVGDGVATASLILNLNVLFFGASACLIAYGIYKGLPRIRGCIGASLAMLAGFAIAVAPWVIHNNIEMGSTVPKLILSVQNSISPAFEIHETQHVEDFGQDIRRLPPELMVDREHPSCSPTGGKEELDRYWGSTVGWRHYVTLPWRTVMNLDSVGYYVTTMPALLLFPLLLLLPYFWSKKGRWLRWLFCGTLFILVQWVFLANGIPWYGIGVFLGLIVGLEAMVAKAPDILGRVAVSILLTLSLFSTFAMRFWQFEQQRSILEYSFGKVSAEVLEELTIPHYNDITQIALQRNEDYRPQNRPYLYRVGTFIPYFIPRNLEVIGLNDHQLDVFNCLFQERDAELTLQRLKSLGFNSIIFDTNTATIEQDPQGSLHKKVEAFQQFVNTPSLGLQVLIYDPGAGVAFIAIP